MQLLVSHQVITCSHVFCCPNCSQCKICYQRIFGQEYRNNIETKHLMQISSNLPDLKRDIIDLKLAHSKVLLTVTLSGIKPSQGANRPIPQNGPILGRVPIRLQSNSVIGFVQIFEVLNYTSPFGLSQSPGLHTKLLYLEPKNY